MKTMTYKVSDIRSMIQESSNEFKAKLGPGVKSGNETNNGKAYKDAEKRAKDYDGGLADSIEVAKYDKTKEGDDNRTTLDYEVDNVDQKYKDRIKAQAEGYTSVAEKENGIEKQGDFEGNKNIFNAIKDDSDAWKEERAKRDHSGIVARTYDKERFEHDSLYESKYIKKSDASVIARQLNNVLQKCEDEDSFKCIFAKNCLEWLEKNSGCEIIAVGTSHFMADIIKQCYFGEEHEDFFVDELVRGKCIATAKDGTKMYTSDDIFGIVDSDGMALYLRKIDTSEKPQPISENKNVKTAYFKKTTFLTEGHMMSRIPDEFKVEENVFRMKDKTGNEYLLEWKNGKAEIISHSNKQGMNESIERMKALYGYKASDYYKGTSTASRLNEDNEAFTDTLNKMRKIIK